MELKDIQELMRVLKKEELAEIKVKYGNLKLTITNSENNNTVKQPAKKIQESVEKAAVEQINEEVIKSSNVGKIRLLNVRIGMPVKKGELLAKINTMGIDNDIKSTVNGILKEVLVVDGTGVDFAKELFRIEIK